MMNRWKWFFGAVATLLVIAIVILITPIQLQISAVQSLNKADVLLLDPGHGGIDGGAESAGGVSEKNINLYIALLIREMAEVDGWTVIMTRDEDKGLYSEKDRQSIRSLKTEDLLARKKIIEEKKPLMTVSIHLNSFKQDPGVRGAQTFYPADGEQDVLDQSKLLAETIQANLIEGIADGTNRTALAKGDVLLLKNPSAPIAIVECGFLSNREEASLLNTEAYQREIAKCIYKGIMEYSGKKGKPPLKIIDNRG